MIGAKPRRYTAATNDVIWPTTEGRQKRKKNPVTMSICTRLKSAHCKFPESGRSFQLELPQGREEKNTDTADLHGNNIRVALLKDGLTPHTHVNPHRVLTCLREKVQLKSVVRRSGFTARQKDNLSIII